MSGIAPLALVLVSPTGAQEIRPIEAVRSIPVPERFAAESIEVDALTLESDFTVFMRPDCPPDLQRKALRKLWTLLPPTPIADSGI